MAMIRCSECGRAISTQASACVGCGAPLSAGPAFNWVPAQSRAPAPTAGQLARRAALAAAALVFGIIWANALNGRAAGSRVEATLAALLIIVGLCGCIVTLLQGIAARR
ncbi:MAG: hypothetical protein ABSH23_04105 [Steroidobacteraceae bacterium]|jgi:hypothetical protein